MVSVAVSPWPFVNMANLTAADMSSNMRLDMGSILASGLYSDFRIKCDKHTFNVHKAVLRCASAYFKATIENNTKVSRLRPGKTESAFLRAQTNILLQEQQENAITMTNDDPAIIARLLIFIYTGEYLVRPLSSWKYDKDAPFTTIHDTYKTAADQWQVACKLAVRMYQIADMTLIEPLRWNTRNRFLTSMRPDRDAKTEGLNFWATNEMKDVTEIIKLAYDNTRADDIMLHDPIVHRMLMGMQHHRCVKWNSYQALVDEVPRLAFEIATSQLGGRRCAPKCRSCGKKTAQRLWRCRCGEMENCEDKECMASRRVRWICDTCAKFGTCE